ncbi:MAG: hypothetical protein AAFO95_19365, partial [Cyanobacteria bacterium J06600_6]
MKSIVGKILYDRYRIVRQLNRQSHSAFYLAEDLANDSRSQCTIQQLQPRYEQEVLGLQSWQKVSQAFLVRGNLLQKVSQHPQVLELLAFFECDREFYLVQQSVKGTTLEQKLENILLDESEALIWLQEILRILEFAHKSGVAHLNIQPSSLVELEDGTKYLTNFAGTKAIASRLNQDFAPQQDFALADLNSDIYALGKTIIYALTGKQADSVQSKSFEEVKSEQLTNLNNSPTADIRPELARTLNKMVSSHQEDHYQSVTEVLKEIDFSQDQDVVTFPPPFISSENLPYQSTSPARTNNKRRKSARSSKSGSRLIWGLLSLPFIIAAAIVFFGLSKNSYRNFVEYTNNDYQFTLKYPRSWSEAQIDDPITGEVVVFNSPRETEVDLFLEKVYVAVEYLSSEPTNLEEYSRTVLERINKTEGSSAEPYEEFRSTIDNAPARTVIYSRQQGELQLRQMESFTIKNNQVYIAIYT